jgi:cobalt-zinc-cadmium efflux system outer membrane protein
MAQAVEMAKAKNPTLLSALQNLLSVKAQEEQASVRANPYFQLGGTNISLPAEGASNPYAYSFAVSRLFERGQKRRWRIEGAKSTTAQTEAQYQTQVQQVVLSVRQAFTTVVLTKAALQIANENLSDFTRELKIFEERLNAGDIAQLDYKRLDLQLAQFESDQTAAEAALAQASDQLQTLLGMERPSPDFQVVGEVVPPAVPSTVDQLEQAALAKRPDYSAARYGIEVADANLQLARSNALADPTLGGEYDRSGTDNSAGFSLNIPIRIFDRNKGNIDTGIYLTQASRFAMTAVHNQVISDVSQAWVGYTTAKRLSDRYASRYLQEAKDVRDIVQFSYEHGGIALIDYLDAIRDYRAVTADSLNAYTQTWMAIHQLSYVTATDVIP